MIFSPRLLVVNADDFGQSSVVNQAIVMCFQDGLISSTTIMANMPAFEDACELARCNDLQDCIGVHLNFTDGEPLLPELQDNRKLCDDTGRFRRFRSRVLSRNDCAMLAAEAAAQIQRCRMAGLPLTHADSHQHVHTEPMVLQAIMPVLKEFQIRRLRISRNMDSRSLISPKRVAKSCFNRWLTIHGIRGTDYFGTVENFENYRAANLLAGRSFEIMTHPSLDAHGALIDHIDNLLLADRLANAFRDLQLSGYEPPTVAQAARL